MSITSRFTITGHVRIVQRYRDGTIGRAWTAENQITNAAATALAQWLTGAPNTGSTAYPPPAQMMLGTGSGTVSPTDTALFAAVSTTLVPVSQRGPVATNPLQAQWVGVWGPSFGPLTATEIGLFAGGTLWAHLAGLNLLLSATTTTSAAWVWDLQV